MRRSKLELYEEILNALAEKSRTVDGIAYRCNMDCVVLNERLAFLVKNNLVEQNFCSKKPLYMLTRSGNAIYKTLTLAKRLEKLQHTNKTLDEAVQALPFLPEDLKEKIRKTGNENY